MQALVKKRLPLTTLAGILGPLSSHQPEGWVDHTCV
jgi:hypothetical protein